MVRRVSGNLPVCRNVHQRWRRPLAYEHRSEMFLLVTDFTYLVDDKWLVKELVVAGSHKNRICQLLLAVRQIGSADCYWLSDKSCLVIVTGCQKSHVF